MVLVKESDHECFSDDKLSEKVLDVKKTIEESEKSKQDGWEMLSEMKNNKKIYEEEIYKLKNENDNFK